MVDAVGVLKLLVWGIILAIVIWIGYSIVTCGWSCVLSSIWNLIQAMWGAITHLF